MAGPIGSIGTTAEIFLGAPATYDESGIDGLSSGSLIGSISNHGEYGGSANVETFTPVDTGIVDKAVGSINYGSYAMTIGKDPDDTGQAALKSGFDGDNSRKLHTIVITKPNNYREAFTGFVTSFTTNITSAGPFITGAANFELNNKVLYLDPVTP